MAANSSQTEVIEAEEFPRRDPECRKAKQEWKFAAVGGSGTGGHSGDAGSDRISDWEVGGNIGDQPKDVAGEEKEVWGEVEVSGTNCELHVAAT